MPNNNPEGKGGFKAGESGNPAGRPQLPAEIKAIKSVSPQYVKKIMSKLLLMKMTEDEARAWAATPLINGGPTHLELYIASIIFKGIQDGDHGKLSFLLDRTIGKVVEQRNVQLQAVKYVTTVRADGALMQEVINEALGEEAGDGAPGE